MTRAGSSRGEDCQRLSTAIHLGLAVSPVPSSLHKDAGHFLHASPRSDSDVAVNRALENIAEGSTVQLVASLHKPDLNALCNFCIFLARCKLRRQLHSLYSQLRDYRSIHDKHPLLCYETRPESSPSLTIWLETAGVRDTRSPCATWQYQASATGRAGSCSGSRTFQALRSPTRLRLRTCDRAMRAVAWVC